VVYPLSKRRGKKSVNANGAAKTTARRWLLWLRGEQEGKGGGINLLEGKGVQEKPARKKRGSGAEEKEGKIVISG